MFDFAEGIKRSVLVMVQCGFRLSLIARNFAQDATAGEYGLDHAGKYIPGNGTGIDEFGQIWTAGAASGECDSAVRRRP